jgi:PST family polysaccharide transporter
MNVKWIDYLPRSVRTKLADRHELQAILGNSGWLFTDKIIRMSIGLLVGVWIARYLGPEQFGLLHYAMAFVTLFGGAASLGLNGIVVRELVKDSEQANSILGTAFILQMLGAFIAFFLIVVTINLVRPDDIPVKLIISVMGFALIFKSTEVIKYWFESQVRSRYAVWVETGSYMTMVFVKIILIYLQAPLIAFVWAIFTEAVLVAIGLLAIYAKKVGQFHAWRVSLQRAKFLLYESWPLLLSGTLVLVNMSIDKIMLGHMANAREVGLYAAATALVVPWYFIPVAIIGSIVPKLIKLHSVETAAYEQLSGKLYKYFGAGTLLIALVISFFSDFIISFLYGTRFEGAGSALAISIFAVVFVFQVSFRGRLLIIEGEQVYISVLIFLGTLTNITLNICLIPTYGAIGAASAYTISWGMSALVYPILFKRTRPHSLMCLGIHRH